MPSAKGHNGLVSAPKPACATPTWKVTRTRRRIRRRHCCALDRPFECLLCVLRCLSFSAKPSTGKWCGRHRQEMPRRDLLRVLILQRVSRRPHLRPALSSPKQSWRLALTMPLTPLNLQGITSAVLASLSTHEDFAWAEGSPYCTFVYHSKFHPCPGHAFARGGNVVERAQQKLKNVFSTPNAICTRPFRREWRSSKVLSKHIRRIVKYKGFFVLFKSAPLPCIFVFFNFRVFSDCGIVMTWPEGVLRRRLVCQSGSFQQENWSANDQGEHTIYKCSSF